MEILNLRAAGMVVGGLGSAAGLFGVANALTRHEPGVAPAPGDAGALTIYAVAALCGYAVGLLGAVLANSQPRLAATLMVLGAVTGMLVPNVPAMALLVFGAFLVYSGRDDG